MIITEFKKNLLFIIKNREKNCDGSLQTFDTQLAK